MIKGKFPLPKIDTLLDRLGRVWVFSRLDFTSGYSPISIAKTSMDKISFRTHIGIWDFLAMLFGLCNAPASFQGLMNRVLKDKLNSLILGYLDNILLFSHSIEAHRGYLCQTLQRLRDTKLYRRLHQCDFLKRQS